MFSHRPNPHRIRQGRSKDQPCKRANDGRNHGVYGIKRHGLEYGHSPGPFHDIHVSDLRFGDLDKLWTPPRFLAKRLVPQSPSGCDTQEQSDGQTGSVMNKFPWFDRVHEARKVCSRGYLMVCHGGKYASVDGTLFSNPTGEVQGVRWRTAR